MATLQMDPLLSMLRSVLIRACTLFSAIFISTRQNSVPASAQLDDATVARVEQAFRPFNFINAGDSRWVEQAFRPAVRRQTNSASAAEVNGLAPD